MCDPMTLTSLFSAGANIIQGNVNRDTAQRQTDVGTRTADEARRTLRAGQTSAEQAIRAGTEQAIGTLDPFAQMGRQAGQSLFGLATGANPLTSDALFQRELQLASQAGASRGVSTSPSFLAETSAALLPGLEQRKANLLSPIFTAGLGASTNIASLQSGQGTALATLANTYSPIFANLDIQRGNIGIENIARQAPQISQLVSNLQTLPWAKSAEQKSVAPVALGRGG